MWVRDEVYYVVMFVSDLQWFSPGTPVSAINTDDRHDIAEILLKVALGQLCLNFLHLLIIW